MVNRIKDWFETIYYIAKLLKTLDVELGKERKEVRDLIDGERDMRIVRCENLEDELISFVKRYNVGLMEDLEKLKKQIYDRTEVLNEATNRISLIDNPPKYKQGSRFKEGKLSGNVVSHVRSFKESYGFCAFTDKYAVTLDKEDEVKTFEISMSGELL